MNKPILVVMAAGLGSRYGGLKQLDSVGPSGETLMEFSIYDAIIAGFQKVVFIIRKDYEEEFKVKIGDALLPFVEVEYAFQELDDIPNELEIDKNRTKPLGTAHAIYTARHLLDQPFAVINADDYYGRSAFCSIYCYLLKVDRKSSEHCMVGYDLIKTLTDNGYVSRGVCNADSDNYLTSIIERVHIEKTHLGGAYLNEANEWIDIDSGSKVSMNLWGFTPSILKSITRGFTKYFKELIKNNPLKGEYYIPMVVDKIIQEDEASVKVLETSEKWYGVTYSSDKEVVVEALREMSEKGRYEVPLW